MYFLLFIIHFKIWDKETLVPRNMQLEKTATQDRAFNGPGTALLPGGALDMEGHSSPGHRGRDAATQFALSATSVLPLRHSTSRKFKNRQIMDYTNFTSG